MCFGPFPTAAVAATKNRFIQDRQVTTGICQNIFIDNIIFKVCFNYSTQLPRLTRMFKLDPTL